jgi:hypothetical protein
VDVVADHVRRQVDPLRGDGEQHAGPRHADHDQRGAGGTRPRRRARAAGPASRWPRPARNRLPGFPEKTQPNRPFWVVSTTVNMRKTPRFQASITRWPWVPGPAAAAPWCQ